MAKDAGLSGAARGVKGLSTLEGQGTCFAAQSGEAQLQMFRSLADHSQEFIGICDLEFKPFYVNEAGQKLVGLGSLEEACAARVQDYFFPEDQRYISEEFFPKVLREGAAEVEIRFRHFKTGAAVWMIYNVFQVRGADGRVSGYATVSRDITDRRRAEEAVRSAALFPAENPFPVARVDGEGKLLFANRASLGLLAEWRCAVGGYVPEGVKAAVQEALKGEGARELEVVVGGRTISFVLTPIGERGYVNLYGRDITERRRTEAALRESEERLLMALRAEKVGMWEWDLRTNRAVWSDRIFELIGEAPSAGHARAELFFQRVHPEDLKEMERSLARAREGGEPWEHEFRVVWQDGQVRWLAGVGRVLHGANGEAERMIGVNYDITERRMFQAELQRLVDERTAKLQELVGELEHFSYTITHDLKAPLRAMRGFAEMMRMTCEECERVQANEFLARISTSAERMDHLIADALSYSRAVRQELPLEDVDAGALLRGMLDSYPELQPDQARIRVEGLLPVVLANEAGLTQCFSNLLGNAVKFVRHGERPDVRVWASERKGWVRIWVEDKGIGIGGDMLPRVFEMFSRASKDYEGTGIGLALVRKVVQRMGGRVGVESQEGEGSRFWIELKCGEREAVLAGDRARQAQATGAGAGTVLYVEDEDSDAMFMRLAFEGKGIGGRLRVVRNGRLAMEYLSGAGEYANREKYPVPAVVLLDLNLPQVPGFEVLEWMRNNPDYARTPVVIFSSSTREDDRVRAQELGANQFISKPSSGMNFGEVVEGLREKWMG